MYHVLAYPGGVLYGVYAVWCCVDVCSYSAVWRCMGMYGCMAPGGRRNNAWVMYGAKYSEIQQKSIQQTIQSQPSHMAHVAAVTPTLGVAKLQ